MRDSMRDEDGLRTGGNCNGQIGDGNIAGELERLIQYLLRAIADGLDIGTCRQRTRLKPE